MDKIILYSCLVGDRDNKIEDSRLYVNGCDKFSSNVMKAKAPKILPHLYLPDHEYSIWIDANVELTVSEEELIQLLGPYPCMVFKHHYRSSIEEEIEECITFDLKKNLEYHKGKGGVLAGCTMLVRKNSPLCNLYNEKWWAEICRGSFRDQLSFPYTLGKISKYVEITPGLYPHTQFFKRNPHRDEIVFGKQ
jgi:hypothetical protein